MTRRMLARWLISHTHDLLAPLALSVIARICNQLLGVALMVSATMAAIDLAGGRQHPIGVVVLTLAGMALAKAALRYLEHYAGHYVAFASLQRLREVFFAALIPQAPATTQGRAGSELTERATSDIDRIEVFFAHTFPPAISAVAVPLIALGWLGSQVHPLLAWVAAPFVAAAIVVLPMLTTARSWTHARAIARERGRIAEQIGDDIQGVREILGFGAQGIRLRLLANADEHLGRLCSRAGAAHGIHNALVTAIQTTSLLVMTMVGVQVGLGFQQITLGLACVIALWGPAAGIDDFTSGLDSAFAATTRIHEVITAAPRVTDDRAVSGLVMPRQGTISISHVSYSYGPGVPALYDVCLDMPAGSWSYVVGVSGSGKSTLASLLLRGRDPDAGVIRLDGRELSDFPLAQLRGRIALAQQRPTMLSESLADNLRLAAPDADDQAVAEALEIACLDEWIATLPEGLETQLSERGLNVSGGQLQRLSLARALLAKPSVLILDEALSQLDGDTAALVRQRLADHRAGLTIVEITHRTDLIPDDAPVTVLDAGRVVEQGRAADLRATDGPFHLLSERG